MLKFLELDLEKQVKKSYINVGIEDILTFWKTKMSAQNDIICLQYNKFYVDADCIQLQATMQFVNYSL